jgi:hypothetical protein
VDTSPTSFNSGGSTTFTRQFYLLLIGQGPGNNTLIRILGHLTIRPDGISMEIFDVSFVECR